MKNTITKCLMVEVDYLIFAGSSFVFMTVYSGTRIIIADSWGI